MSKFPFPIPHGWFGLCFSHELKAGEVRKIRFCGRDIALFRTESGRAAALENYCAHLGASLSGGCVKGEALQCPFHNWQWNADGACSHIPYSDRIPTRAVTDALPVQEINGMVMGWHHPEGREPYFEIEPVPGLNGDADIWGEREYAFHDIPTCVQEIAENDVDSAHFQYVHGSPSFTETETTVSGPVKQSISEMELSEEMLVGLAVDTGTEPFRLHRHSSGPGSVILRGTGIKGLNGEMGEFLMYSVNTPVEDDRSFMYWTMAVSKNLQDDDMGKTMLHGFATGIDDDMPIWGDKIYRENPVLCDGDGPINKHRKFFSQFYS